MKRVGIQITRLLHTENAVDSLLSRGRTIKQFKGCLEQRHTSLSCLEANISHIACSKVFQGVRSLSNFSLNGYSTSHFPADIKNYKHSHLPVVDQLNFVKRSHHTFSRQWLTQLWPDEHKLNRLKYKERKRFNKKSVTEDSSDPLSAFQNIFSAPRVLANSEVEAQPVNQETLVTQIPPTQNLTGALKPTSPEEVKVAPLLARANLLITRDVEWANLMFGFEQENRYAVVDPFSPSAPVGFIREKSSLIMRQILRTRRYFTASMTDAWGNELCRVRRPVWFINSTIHVEIDGKEIGVVHRRWHLWRRIYDLYLGNKQFAYVENAGFWDWTFTLKDENGETLAEIDRDWRGFGFEMFTDAGQYVIRFGDSDTPLNISPATQIKELKVSRPLNLRERAITVALAVSLDCDYFSRHSGWHVPFVPFWGGDE